MAYKPTCPTLAKVADHEPIFVLRAQDRFAPEVIRHWAALADGGTPREKLRDAYRCAEQMEAWQQAHTCKWPD